MQVQITPVVLNLTPMQVAMLQDAVAYRHEQLASVVNNADLYPDQPADNPERVAALASLTALLDRY